MGFVESVMRLTFSRRLLLAVLVGIASFCLCTWNLQRRGWEAGDFTFSWRAANCLLAGANPYTEIRPVGVYPYQTYFYYPLTAALATLPLAGLPPELAGGAFFGLGSGLLAFALSRYGWRYLPLFLSAPYIVAGAVAQWSPLLLSAALLPGLEWLLSCKPNLGAALFLMRPSVRRGTWIVSFLFLSLFCLPAWPFDWLRVVLRLAGHFPPAAALPFGPLLLLALLHWRRAEGRLLLTLALSPQLLFFYDQLPLWLLAPGLGWGLIYSGLSWVTYFAWRFWGIDPLTGQILTPPAQYILAGVYLPALGMLFLRNKPINLTQA